MGWQNETDPSLHELLMDIHAKLSRVDRAVAVLAARADGGRSQSEERSREAKEIGDYEVRWDPRAWQGGSMKGRKFKDCPVEFLMAMRDAYFDMENKNRRAGDKEKADSAHKMGEKIHDLVVSLNRIGAR